MHLFHIRSVSSLLLLLLGVLTALVLLLLLPATFLMVLWNALIFESFKGPEINLYEGFLLWGVVAIALKLVLQPEIRFQIQTFPRSSGASQNTPSENTASKEQADSSARGTLESKVDSSVTLEASSATLEQPSSKRD